MTFAYSVTLNNLLDKSGYIDADYTCIENCKCVSAEAYARIRFFRGGHDFFEIEKRGRFLRLLHTYKN